MLGSSGFTSTAQPSRQLSLAKQDRSYNLLVASDSPLIDTLFKHCTICLRTQHLEIVQCLSVISISSYVHSTALYPTIAGSGSVTFTNLKNHTWTRGQVQTQSN